MSFQNFVDSLYNGYDGSPVQQAHAVPFKSVGAALCMIASLASCVAVVARHETKPPAAHSQALPTMAKSPAKSGLKPQP